MGKKNAKQASPDGEPLLKSHSKKRSSSEDDDQNTKRPRIEERTDFTRWRLRDDKSRMTWQYLEDDEAAKEWPQTFADKYFLGLPVVSKA